MKFYKHLRRVSVSSSIVNTTLDKVRSHVSTKDLEKISQALQHFRSFYGKTITLDQFFTECDAALRGIKHENASFIADAFIRNIHDQVTVALCANEHYTNLRDQTIERGYIGAGDAGIMRDRVRIACFALLSMPDADNTELEMMEAKIRLRHQISASLIHFDRLQMAINEECEDDEGFDEDDEDGDVIIESDAHPAYIADELIDDHWFAESVQNFAKFYNHLPIAEKQRFHLFIEHLLDYICKTVYASIQEHNPNFAKEIKRITMLECFEPNQFVNEDLVENAILETIRNVARDFFDYEYDNSTEES